MIAYRSDEDLTEYSNRLVIYGGEGMRKLTAGPLDRLVMRLLAVVCWLAPLVWFAVQREWSLLAGFVPFTGVLVWLATRKGEAH